MLDIAKIVCDVYGITVDEMQSASQEGKLPEARQMIMYVMFRYGFNGVETAKIIKRTRTIVCRYRTKIKHEIPIYKATRDKYNKIIETIETIKNKE